MSAIERTRTARAVAGPASPVAGAAPSVADAIPRGATTPRAVVRKRPGGGPVEWVLVHIAFAVTIAFFLAPFVWMVLAAIDSRAEAYIRWPEDPTLANFRAVFERFAFGTALRNSLIVSTATMVLTVLTVALAGYSLSRLSVRRKDWFSYTVLLLQTMPLSATMVPIYGLARELGLRNSYLGLVLVHTAIELPFLTWMMKGFFDAVPRYLEEAAWIDGRTKLRAWFEILLPVARPGLGVAAGLSFLSAWAEVLMVIILVDEPGFFTVPFAFYRAARGEGSYMEVRYEIVAAMGVLYVLPVLVLFFATRKLMVRGLMGTARGV
ncbi:MAG: carbohydrate ABC transporter permease [Chloroflexia bacterium]|nr:carbohydrate ABC transporter permease [Chloroflexia bacterium]